MAKIIKYQMVLNSLDNALDVVLECSTEEAFQANLLIAEKEAYNGEYTVEDDGQPEPEIVVQKTTDDVLNALLGVTE